MQDVVLAALLPPPLLEVVQHVPCRWAFDLAVDVVPWLPRPAIVDGRAGDVVLVEIVGVRRVERAEQGVGLRVVAAVGEVDAADEADDAAEAAGTLVGVHDDGLLVVAERHRLPELDGVLAVVEVTRAGHAVHATASEVAERVGIVGAELAGKDANVEERGRVVPHQHEHAHALFGLALEELADGGAAAGVLPVPVTHQRGLGVHRPAGDVHEVSRAVDGVVDVLPAPARLVRRRAAGELDVRPERVQHVRVLVQRHPAPLPLLEEGPRHAGVLLAVDAAAEAGVSGHVGEPCSHVDLRPVREWFLLVVEDV